MNTNQNKSVIKIFTLGFLFALNTAIPAYINSTFMSGIVKENIVGWLYAISSLLVILLLVTIPKILKKTGNYKITNFFLWAYFFSLLAMAFSPNNIVVTFSFVLSLILINILFFNMDIFLEHFSKNESTGGVRGSYLSIINLAWLFSPMVAGFILVDHNYWSIYLVAALLILPIIYLLNKNFKNFEDPEYEETKFWKALKIIRNDYDVFRIVVANFILKFFYSWMVIYTPIYLHEHVGFDWRTIGYIFTFMLLPFVLLELPLGKLADQKIGEKEILNLGFIITAIMTGLLTFVSSPNAIIWAILLFGTRIGASMIEISTESYFFKKVSADDSNIISFFRMTSPIAYLIGPFLAGFLLFFIPFNQLFMALAILILLPGLYFGARITDTR